MGKIELSQTIMGQMKTWGGNVEDNKSSHNGVADKVSSVITNTEQMGNPKTLNQNMAKPADKNPGVDRAFLAKGNPTMDVTGHGKLTRSCKD